jgi:hypothetical protein
VAAGIARLVASAHAALRSGRRPQGYGIVIASVGLVVVLIAIAVVAWPPNVSPDGGWRAAENDAVTIEGFAAGRPYSLVGIPPFKTTDAVRFPLEHLGATPGPADAVGTTGGPDTMVIVCDPLFDEATGSACGGEAEAAWFAARGIRAAPMGGSHAAPRRVISAWRIER